MSSASPGGKEVTRCWQVTRGRDTVPAQRSGLSLSVTSVQILLEAAPAPLLPPGKSLFSTLSALGRFVPGVAEEGKAFPLIKALSLGRCFVSGRVAKLKRQTAFRGRMADFWNNI